jgi:hypothetical protein
MSAPTTELPFGTPAYITGEGVDREAALHRRRKSAMVSLLSEFEREIEPHVSGHENAIENFKRSCRKKLNGLVFEAVELMKLEPGEHLNEHAVDLAERLAYDATED